MPEGTELPFPVDPPALFKDHLIGLTELEPEVLEQVRAVLLGDDAPTFAPMTALCVFKVKEGADIAQLGEGMAECAQKSCATDGKICAAYTWSETAEGTFIQFHETSINLASVKKKKHEA